ncbi:porin family protein [Halomonas pacifica]|uniref:porin family protein n=1 Tax=Bisbaumannia pacifica TaxID=77098 RepID=UPI00235972AD|nr:porin family protein [Halomonas pacifica]MDC8802360.1 porin family protein [Halomonas pacifica]
MRFLVAASTAALLAAGAFATTAQANQHGFYPQGYVGGDVMFWELDPDGAGSVDDIGLRLRGGMQFNDYFAVEGHLGTGGSETVQGVEAELDDLVGAFAKGILPISQEFRLYGLLGYSEVDIDLSPGGSARDDGFSYGAGAEYEVAPNLAVGADYIRYLDKSEGDFDAASLGLRYRF